MSSRNSSFLPGEPLSGPVDLTNCDREPIQIPAEIQGFGAMVVIRREDRIIVSHSENFNQWLHGIHFPIVGRAVNDALPELTDLFHAVCDTEAGRQIRRRYSHFVDSSTIVSGHHCARLVIFEFESADEGDGVASPGLLEKLFAGTDGLHLQQVYDRTVRVIRDFTGFSRVMLYQFLEDEHGVVIAESVEHDAISFLGLHYPASDIPLVARKLYELKWIRTIADVDGVTHAMVPPLVDRQNSQHVEPIDMTYCDLRAVSSIHIEYLRNMGVRSSMSISIICHGRLWGLIACHHCERKIVSPQMREACELAGSLLSTYLTSRMQHLVLQQRIAISERISKGIGEIVLQEDVGAAIGSAGSWLCEMFGADGFISVQLDDRVYWGDTPSEAETTQLINALDAQSKNPILFSDSILAWDEQFKDISTKLPGMLVLRLGQNCGSLLLFFRKPYEAELQWAGNPNEAKQDNDGRLSPRKSFATFTQSVTNRSRPWSIADRETAEQLLSVINTMVVEQAEKLSRVNEELRRLNSDLDAFAYAASHDLKEPLRGIYHHVYMLEQARELTGPTFERGMSSLKRLVSRMSELIDGLLRFSRAGRQELHWERFTLSEVVEQAKDVVFGGLPSENVKIEVTFDDLISGDFACVREVISNLISNGIKYNDSAVKRISVSVESVEKTPLRRSLEYGSNVICVSDNGIGIPLNYQKQVFDIFRRLHEPNAYGGGSGAGLTIVRRMVERHDGRIALVSDGNSGSTFYFGWKPK